MQYSQLGTTVSFGPLSSWTKNVYVTVFSTINNVHFPPYTKVRQRNSVELDTRPDLYIAVVFLSSDHILSLTFYSFNYLFRLDRPCLPKPCPAPRHHRAHQKYTRHMLTTSMSNRSFKLKPNRRSAWKTPRRSTTSWLVLVRCARPSIGHTSSTSSSFSRLDPPSSR